MSSAFSNPDRPPIGPESSPNDARNAPSGQPTSAVTRDAARLRVMMSASKQNGVTDAAVADTAASDVSAPQAPATNADASDQATAVPPSNAETRLRPLSPSTESRPVRDVERLQKFTRTRREQAAAAHAETALASTAPPEPVMPAESHPSAASHSLPRTAIPRNEAPAAAGRARTGFATGIRIAAVLATIVAGTLLGALLYAGGADYIGHFFRGQRDVPVHSPSATTSVAEAPVHLAPAPGPVPDPVDVEEDPVDEQPIYEEPPPSMIPNDVAAVPERRTAAQADHPVEQAPSTPAGPVRPLATSSESPHVVDADAHAAADVPAASDRSATGVEVGEPNVHALGPTQPSNAAFTVQVRATTDHDEAARIAHALESTGAGNVRILESDKNGKRFYRIRFGAFASVDQALGAAHDAGYDDAWIVPQ